MGDHTGGQVGPPRPAVRPSDLRSRWTADPGDFERLVVLDSGLCIVTTLRDDRTMQASVVDAGVLPHPVVDTPVVGFVAGGATRKLTNLRAHRQATVVVRAGWEWVAVEGPVELVGPDDDQPRIDRDISRLLLRHVFAAAGGTHNDWGTFDRVMADERRAAVLVTPERVYSNALG